MRAALACTFIAALVVTGWLVERRRTSPVPLILPDAMDATADPEPPPFRGTVAGSLDWSLCGLWRVTAYTEEGKPPSGKGDFAATWRLVGKGDDGVGRTVWHDRTLGETFTLLRGRGTGDRLRWRRYRGRIFDFSINEQSYGYLDLVDQDGDRYVAVRLEGGD